METIRLICLWTVSWNCVHPRVHLFIMVRPAQLFLEHKTPTFQACRNGIQQRGRLFTSDDRRNNGCGLFTEFSSKKIQFFFEKMFYVSRSRRGTARALSYETNSASEDNKFPFVVKFIIPDARIVLRPPCCHRSVKIGTHAPVFHFVLGRVPLRVSRFIHFDFSTVRTSIRRRRVH
jgi:hypothetical protein